MAVRQRSYWLSLKGMPETTNVESVIVQIPKTNVFNPAALLDIMEPLEKGERL